MILFLSAEDVLVIICQMINDYLVRISRNESIQAYEFDHLFQLNSPSLFSGRKSLNVL